MSKTNLRLLSLSEQDRARFLAKVQKTEKCWHWTGATSKAGYGHLRSREKHTTHRVAFAILVGGFARLRHLP